MDKSGIFHEVVGNVLIIKKLWNNRFILCFVINIYFQSVEIMNLVNITSQCWYTLEDKCYFTTYGIIFHHKKNDAIWLDHDIV